MAGTIVLGQFENGAASFELDYDDNMDVLTFRCNNLSGQEAFGLLKRDPEDGVQFGLSAPAGQITTIALPQGNQGIRLTPPTGSGFGGHKPGGYSVDLRHPA